MLTGACGVHCDVCRPGLMELCYPCAVRSVHRAGFIGFRCLDSGDPRSSETVDQVVYDEMPVLECPVVHRRAGIGGRQRDLHGFGLHLLREADRLLDRVSCLAGDRTDAGSLPTHELMSWLNDVERDRFVKFQETFETLGRKLVEEYDQGLITYHIVQGANAATWEKANQHRGAREALERIANLATMFMTEFEHTARTNQASASEAVDEPE